MTTQTQEPTPSPEDLEAHTIAGSHYGFSAVRLEDLGATEYTLVAIAADASPSVSPFAKHIEACVGEVIRSCGSSPRADNLLVRTLKFDHGVDELHGFAPLPSLSPSQYRGRIRGGGGTALYDAAANVVESVASFAGTLGDADFDCNAIVVVITDGMDNSSKIGPAELTRAVERAASCDDLESLVTILVGVGIADASTSRYLTQVREEAGFDRYIELDKADAKTLARLADFVSRSVATQSRALGSGAATNVVGF